MKYTYAYKTSDGVRHEDSMDASSREEVFGILRAKGIKAIKVVAADGSKANGAPPPKRRLAFYILLVSALAAVAAIFLFPFSASHSETAFIADGTRRQVIGDAAVIEKGIRTGWSNVFGREGDRFLASFAIPGAKAGQRSTSEKEIRLALGEKVEPQPTDSIEVRQIKAIVEGMKDEARRYLAAGGTIQKYGERLIERQDAEIAICNRVKSELDKAHGTMSPDAFETMLEERNDELRNLGLRPVVFAEQ